MRSDVCGVIIIANIIRIFFWLGEHFEIRKLRSGYITVIQLITVMVSITASVYFINSLTTPPPCYMPPLLPDFTRTVILFSSSTTYGTTLCESSTHRRL